MIDDAEGYEAMVAEGRIRREFDARVVSNDRFRDRQGAFPEETSRVIRFMVVEGEVVLERRTVRRGGWQDP